MADLTQLIEAVERGDPHASDELLPLVYQELRRLAQFKMNAEVPGQTLQPTALVHEAWLRLMGANQEWKNRRHFFNAAAESMRRILIDRARKRGRIRRGGADAVHVDLSEIDVAVDAPDESLLAVDEVLERFARSQPDKAELVKLRYYVGLSLAEAAEAIGVSESTAKRQWAFARAWLFRELRKEA